MTTVLLSVPINTLWVWVSAQFGTLVRLSVRPTSPVLLTRTSPLGPGILGSRAPHGSDGTRID